MNFALAERQALAAEDPTLAVDPLDYMTEEQVLESLLDSAAGKKLVTDIVFAALATRGDEIREALLP